MKLTKEEIYINLQGKSKEELTELYWVLKNNNQKLARHKLDDFLGYKNHSSCYVLICNDFGWSGDDRFDKIEVTIQQLKEILQPVDLTIEQQLQKAEAEVKRLKEAIEDSEIKVGDWVKRTREGLELFKADKTHDYRYINSEKHLYQKITNTELINKLNELIK